MPDSNQYVTNGHLRDMLAGSKELLQSMERQMKDGFVRMEDDQRERGINTSSRADKIEASITQLRQEISNVRTEVSTMQSEKAQLIFGAKIIRWMLVGSFSLMAPALAGVLYMGWTALDLGGAVLRSNDNVVRTIENATTSRTVQNQEIKQQLNDLKGAVASEPGPSK